MLYAVLKPLAVAVMRLLFRVEGRGGEHVPARGPVLLVANHSSFLDPPLVGGMTPRPLSFMAKAELFRVPLLGALITRLNARPVRREGADASALRTALRILQEGGVLLMFPEGTRGPEGTLREPKPGAAMLAVMSGAPVVPVYVEGSGRAWPRGRRLPRPAKVRVTFGAPLRFERRNEKGRKTDYEAVSRAMMAAIGGLRTVDGHAPSRSMDTGRTGARTAEAAGAGEAIDGQKQLTAKPSRSNGRQGSTVGR